MENKLILDVNQSPNKIKDWLLFALQHILAMFVACITVPVITGLPVDATIVAAGIGTLFYIAVTKRKSPVFLSSSFAYINPIVSALALGEAVEKNFAAVMIGMLIVGVIYVLVALIIKFVGINWLNKLLPPIVIGPVIMVIGLSLSMSAVNNLTGLNSSLSNNSYSLTQVLIGLFAMLLTAIAATYGKKTTKLIPFVIGMVGAYILACILTLIGSLASIDALKVIDFSPVVDNFKNISVESFIKLPDFIFLEELHFEINQLPEVLLLFAPVAFVTICEHIGDHINLGNIIGKDLLKDPGLTKTLIGDGIATAVSGGICGSANTTYGENVAVIGVSKIASTSVIILASIFAILLGFISPLMRIIETIPNCITGGVSLILYGFIASSGVKILMNNKIDFNDTKNIFIASVILVSGIGGLTLQFSFPAISLTITSTAVAMILGILLNLIIKAKTNQPVEE